MKLYPQIGLAGFILTLLGAAILLAPSTALASTAPDLSIAQTCAINGPQSVLCTVTVTNTGTAMSIIPMTLTDTVTGAPSNGQFLGAGGTLPLSCTPGAGPILPIVCHGPNAFLSGGQSKNALFSFKLPTGGTITSCATEAQGTSPGVLPDPNPANNTNKCATITVPGPSGPDVSATKSCVVNGPQSVLCTVTVTNNGPTATQSPIHIADVVSGAPSNATYTGAGGTLPISCSPGAGPIIPISCNANTTLQPGSANSKNALFSFHFPTGGTMTNCATVTTPQTDPTPANNTNICSTVTVPPPAGPDVSATKSCVVNGPQSVLCTVTVTNNGPTATQSPIHIADVVSGAPSNATYTGAGGTLPISCSPGAGPITPISCNANTTLQPGSANSKNALFSFHLPTGGTMTNCATVTTPQTDPTPANNTNICSTVTVPPPAGPDVSATKSCVVNGPQSVLCTVTVTNNGPTATQSPIHIADVVSGAPSNAVITGAGGTLPISCSPGAGPITPISCNANTTLQPGSANSKNALFSFKLPTGGTMTNCATVTTPQADPTPSNNTNICSTVTVPPPTGGTVNFKITKQFSGTPVAGTYILHISCNGGYTGPSTVSLVVPPNPSAAASINVPVGATCQFTENQVSGWQTPLFGGSGQPINPNLPWGATVGPFHATSNMTDQMQVTNVH